MWFYKQTVKHIVALTFKQDYFAYAHIKKNNNQSTYSLINFKKHLFNNLEIEKQVIFNPTRIGNYLHSLQQELVKGNADIRISIDGPAIFEAIVESPDSLIGEPYSSQLKNTVWEDTPIFPNSGTHKQIYVCGISRALLFQYQLLAIKHKFNIQCITTSNMALLNAYHLLKTEFLDQNLATVNDIAKLINIESIDKLCANIPQTDNPLLMAELISLCLAELKYENN